MDTLNKEALEKYLETNYPSFFENEEDDLNRLISEESGYCSSCQRNVYFKINAVYHSRIQGRRDGLPNFITILFECPSCTSNSFIQYAQIKINKVVEDGDGDIDNEIRYRYHRLYRLPTADEHYTSSGIPDTYPLLKETVSEALFCLSHSRNTAAVMLFRRALQIICKDILGAPGGRTTLHKQLEWLKTNPNKLGINLEEVFHDNAAIVKDIGNQGAHPDDDTDLHTFSKHDADGLHDLFLSIIQEIFIKPAKMKALQDELRANRKLR